MLSRVFFLALTLSFIAAPVMGDCPGSQFCSRCPRKDNAGHTLQAEPEDAGYVHCQYQDTDCYYGPKSGTTSLAMGFPANVCPPALVDNVCSSPVVPQRKLLDTVCPFSNNNFINVPLRSWQPEPGNPSHIQCHYSSSECYYDLGTGVLLEVPSIPKPSPPTVPVGVCPPKIVAQHLQYGI